MELIIMNDGIYHLIEVTENMTAHLKIMTEVDCFNLCDILRLSLTTYSETINAHIMNNNSGNLIGCICSN